jgi:serine/threonine protein kinase/Flp pilus assembly protein TadD
MDAGRLSANEPSSGVEGSGVGLGTRKAVRRAQPRTPAPSTGRGWSPPQPRLPGPHDDLTLLTPLGRAAGRDVWAAGSARRPGKPFLVEFLAEAVPAIAEAPGRSRFALDLRPWAEEGWPPAALVTVLPAALPGPYARFELLSFVGLGGMGQVWMAESPDYPDLPLAVKFFTHPVYRQHPALLEQCLQEAKVGISIDSPFVARTYQLLDLRAHQAEGWPAVAMVMPLYEPSLQRVLDDLRAADVPLRPELAVEFARQLLDGLEALHSGHRLVHRDVKPSNVLLRLAGNRPYRGPESLEGATALLSDLGTLCRVGERPLFALGQDGWKAPELFDPPGSSTPAERPADPAEDLYAFGLVLRALADALQPLGAAVAPAAGPSLASAVDVPRESTTRLFTEAAPPAGPSWLQAVTAELTDTDPLRRLAARAGLRARLTGRPAGEETAFPLPRLEQYDVLERVGHGGMSEVYKARHRRLHRLVAIKIFRWEGPEGNLLERLRREAVAIARLSHPAIVQIHEIGEIDGRPFLALEYCGGGDLAEKIDGRPWPSQEAAGLALVLARAMEFAHRQGIIHRDLKPSNVLLAEDGSPKIADFGLARLLDAETELTCTGMVMGTPSYMAPEQAAGHSRALGPSVDVYGLGAILYQLLTGRPPFQGLPRPETLRAVMTTEPVPPRQLAPRVAADLETVCLKCLRKEPQRRYPSAAALAEDLERFLQGEPIRARPVSSWRRSVLLVRRQPVRVVAVLAALLALSFLAALLVVTIDNRRSLALREYDAGDRHRLAGQYEQAIRDYTEAIRLQPGLVRAYLARAEVYRLLKQYDQAVADYSRVLEVEPRNVEALRQRALAYQRLRRYAEAVAADTAVLEIEPGDVAARRDRAAASLALGDAHQPLDDCSWLIEHGGANADVSYLRALAHHRLGEEKAALADCDDAIRRDANFARAYWLRGTLHVLLGNAVAGKADHKRALEFDPLMPPD